VTLTRARGPAVRPRRLRATRALRDAVAETEVSPRHLIAPLFVTSGEPGPVAGMPGVERHAPERALAAIEELLRHEVRTVLLFGVVEEPAKDRLGSASRDPGGPVPRTLAAARRAFGDDVVLVTDVCLCGYTDHGHCGVPAAGPRFAVDNDATLPLLAAMALAHAEAGADLVAPSDMMDGRVGHIRSELDRAGHEGVGVLSYAVKYASAFYGPFREAAGSSPEHGDRSGYQMDPRNRREALREARLDVAEGADMLMVKPALAYLDVIRDVRAATDLPLAAYNVSGEYAMVKHAAAAGALDEPRAVRETLMAIRRAGADLIITYHALDAVRGGWLS
jgi:porphobilinogen synthase